MSKKTIRVSTKEKENTMRAGAVRWSVQLILTVLLVLGAVLPFALSLQKPWRVVLIVGVAYLLFTVINQMWWHHLRSRSDLFHQADENDLLDNITLDTLYQIEVPVLIFDQNEKVIWYNQSFSEKNSKEDPIYARTLQEIADISLADVLHYQGEGGLPCYAFGYHYQVYAYPVSTQSADLYVVAWEDHSEEIRLLQKIKDDDTVISYVIIDNLQELSQYSDQNYRGVSVSVSEALNEWAKQMDGVLKETGNYKYLLLCDAVKMQENCANRFEILDTVRELCKTEDGSPLTVSIGVNLLGGTLEEKENNAQLALDFALQRGGDQAVVKTESGLAFYGGRSKSIQKRTKVRSRVIANELQNLIKASSNVLVMGHRNADFDSLGACVGIARLAMYLDKPVNIVANVQDNNLRLCFDKLYETSDYRKIFVSGSDAQDLVRSNTLLVITDVNNPRQFESSDLASSVERQVIIDHHRKTGELNHPALIAYIEPSASSASELITELLEQVLPAGTLLKEEADVIYSGIVLDSKQFTHNSGVRTFSSAMYLRSEGADPEEAQSLFRTELQDFCRLAKFESSAQIYRGICAIAYYDGEEADNGDRVAAAKVADRLLDVQHVQASFVLCRIGDTINISARSKAQWNVQVILEKLGGGGHYDAAGAQLGGYTMAQAQEKLKEAIDNYINEM